MTFFDRLNDKPQCSPLRGCIWRRRFCVFIPQSKLRSHWSWIIRSPLINHIIQTLACIRYSRIFDFNFE